MSDTNEFFNELKGLAEDFQSLREKNAALAAENERLRKAGDAMASALAFEYKDSPKVSAWLAAKKGSDAK